MNRSRWLIIALAVSVALNIAAVGFIAGHATSERFRPPFANPVFGVNSLIRDLPDARREELFRALREHARGLRPPVREMRRAQTELKDALDADEFDPAVAAAALESFRQSLCDSMARSNEAFVALAERMSPEERRWLVERMERDGPGRFHHGPPEDPSVGPTGGWHPPPPGREP